MIPTDRLYTPQHEWVQVAEDVATVGITDYAQQQLGDVTFVELPMPDDQRRAGDELCAIESAKAAASIYAPLTGSVLEANDDLESSPDLVNDSPYESGWICRVRIADASELDALLTPEQYEQLLRQEP